MFMSHLKVFRRVYKIAKSYCYLYHISLSVGSSVCLFFSLYFCPSVRPHETTWLPPDGFSWTLIFEDFREIYRENSSPVKCNKNNGYIRRRPLKFMIVFHWVLLRMRNALDKFVEKIKTHILLSITFFSENRAAYEIAWKHMVEPDTPRKTIQ